MSTLVSSTSLPSLNALPHPTPLTPLLLLRTSMIGKHWPAKLPSSLWPHLSWLRFCLIHFILLLNSSLRRSFKYLRDPGMFWRIAMFTSSCCASTMHQALDISWLSSHQPHEVAFVIPFHTWGNRDSWMIRVLTKTTQPIHHEVGIGIKILVLVLQSQAASFFSSDFLS